MTSSNVFNKSSVYEDWHTPDDSLSSRWDGFTSDSCECDFLERDFDAPCVQKLTWNRFEEYVEGAPKLREKSLHTSTTNPRLIDERKSHHSRKRKRASRNCSSLKKEKKNRMCNSKNVVDVTMREFLVGMEEELSSHASEPSSSSWFFCQSRPEVQLGDYVYHIVETLRISKPVLIHALIYVDRLVKETQFRLCLLSVHRVILTSIMIASKFMDDIVHSNKTFASIGLVDVEELNKAEKELLFGIKFDLYVSQSLFKNYCEALAVEI